MSKFILSLVCIISIFISNAQNKYYSITGRVVNAATREPLAGASIFAENTTFSTLADEQGNFKLNLPEGGYVIVASMSGFASYSDRVTAIDNGASVMNIEMTYKPKETETVTVVASNEVKNGWEKYGELFNREFIGKTVTAAKCSLRNPEILHFYFFRKKNKLKVLADAPLIIDNHSLGYIVTYELDSLIYDFGKQINFYSGSPYFEEMKDTTSDQSLTKSWKAMRKSSYEGSVLHWMRSVYQKRMTEEGFQIQFLISQAGKDTALQLKDYEKALHWSIDDSTHTVSIRPNQPTVGLLYLNEKPEAKYLSENPEAPIDFQFSTIEFNKETDLHIEKNGFYYEQSDITINDYSSWERMSDMMPYDYEPEETGAASETPSVP